MKTSTHPSCLQTLMLLCTAIPMLICLASLVCAQETLPSWTNRAGKTIKAQFVRLDGEAVVIEKDGKEFRVPFDKLSADSQQQAKTLGSPAQSARAEPSAPPPNSSKPVTLAKDGKTNVVIVESNNAAEPERYAALELAEFLGRVTGATFPIVHEGGFAGKTPAIYVGWTDYAAKNGVDAAALGEEEWVIRTGDDNLILAGGRPRGTLYAVYEFLERPVGCHWLAPDCEVIPSRPSLTLDALNVQGKPWFWRREVLNFPGCSDAQWKFMIRNKNYRYDLKGCRDFSPAGAFYQLQGSPRKVHTFAYFVNGEDYFAAHPEYFALDASGKRIPAYPDKPPGGQLCLTHPDVRRLTKAKLREYIAKDRAEAAEKGCPPPRVYSITQSDQFIITDLHCKCDACQAIAKREGSESGPLIDFINDIAADIEKDYPDVLIQTLAYNLTSVPPKTIKPRKNVLIGWCDVYGISDGARPLSDPLNTRNYREITEWAKVAPRLVIADDYWAFNSRASGGRFPLPYSIIQSIGPDLRLFAACHAESFYAEAYDHLEPGQHFRLLSYWLGYQLLVNPRQPAEPLIKTFMDGYYGAASEPMLAYQDYLSRRIERDAKFKSTEYLDAGFFVTAEKLFDEAETRVKPDSPQAHRLREERLIVDGALLFLWPWLDRRLASDETMPFDHETFLNRYDAEWRDREKGRYHDFYSPQSKRLVKDGKLRERVVGLLRNPKLPAPFDKLPARDVADFNWLTFPRYRPSILLVTDDEAPGGIAAEPAGGSFLDKPLCFGVTDGPTVTVKPENIPQDGNYHLYRIGRITVRPGMLVWAIEGKTLGVCVDRLFVPDSTKIDINDWVAHISLKVQGPSYVKGSTAPNGVWMDRVLLVRPGKDDKLDDAEIARREERQRRLELRPKVQAARCAGAGGDLAKVDWSKAAELKGWTTLTGEATARKLDGRVARDGAHLYVRLAETMNTAKLANDPKVLYGDDWELLFAARRGEPAFRQLGINPEGTHRALAQGDDGLWRALTRGEADNWAEGVKVLSKVGAQGWTVSVAIPLDRLLPNGVKPGQPVYLNVMRGGKQPLVWSPTYANGFRLTEWMGQLALE